MVSFNLISFILVFVTNLDLEIHQVDVKIVILNGGLDELWLRGAVLAFGTVVFATFRQEIPTLRSE